MTPEPDPTNPDPVSYVKAWLHWANELRNKRVEPRPQEPPQQKLRPYTLS
jgi:hypothetical protein